MLSLRTKWSQWRLRLSSKKLHHLRWRLFQSMILSNNSSVCKCSRFWLFSFMLPITNVKSMWLLVWFFLHALFLHPSIRLMRLLHHGAIFSLAITASVKILKVFVWPTFQKLVVTINCSNYLRFSFMWVELSFRLALVMLRYSYWSITILLWMIITIHNSCRFYLVEVLDKGVCV